MTEKNIRLDAVFPARQIIVKAGTRLLIDRASIARLVSGIAALRKSGRQVLLVTSGAVGMGMETLKVARRPRELARIQALAAVGQTRLMSIYSEECAKYGFAAAQLLLTAADLRDRKRYLNVMNCVNSLWESGVLPVVNENDSTSVAELKFGDNDTLAGMLGSLTGSRLTVLLTTEDGLRGRDAAGNLAERISVVPRVTAAIKALAGGTDDAKFSIGGMASKLRAAEIVTGAGEYLWIADGRKEGILEAILRGEDTGTLFLPSGRRLPGHKRWLRFFSRVGGRITADAGAVRALTASGRSLLPSGVIAVDGEFDRGDTVEIVDENGRPVARGLVNFSADDCRRIRGCKSSEIHRILGADSDEELVHRDHLTLLRES